MWVLKEGFMGRGIWEDDGERELFCHCYQRNATLKVSDNFYATIASTRKSLLVVIKVGLPILRLYQKV